MKILVKGLECKAGGIWRFTGPGKVIPCPTYTKQEIREAISRERQRKEGSEGGKNEQ